MAVAFPRFTKLTAPVILTARIQLDLSVEETVALMGILGRTTGSEATTSAKYSHPIYRAIQNKTGITSPFQIDRFYDLTAADLKAVEDATKKYGPKVFKKALTTSTTGG